MFVVERKSAATLRAFERHLGDMRFSLVSVPDCLPRTKPKALNYALPLCRGELLVVFDAEDRPEPEHLRQAVACFRSNPQVECVQARLLITNGHKGCLPALFAGEYAALFTVWLPALADWNLVAPLGGTSNHFRLDTLREIGGWDSYNVTEDADLGVRLARMKCRTMVCPAVTWEDAPRDLNVWMRQRTRWMKGWIQTMVVHNRRFPELVADLGWMRTLLFQIVVIGMIFSPVLHAGFLVCMGIKLALEIPLLPAFGVWSAACGVVLAFGYGVAFIHTILGLRRTGQLALLRYQLLLPVYWLLIGWATLRALFEFAHNPFHWHKTPHQVSVDRKGMERVKGIEPSS
ncbi:MAG: glycosyltransferase [Devosia sp.]|uniref:glycosyltransferase n=1 Tax=Devosia sp. TaxID=1871048 RepID=UPI0024C83464|nr:glycosyltransferase [Devosia sp.]UYN99286.1 MAG: glycosyltransferase [Devosia sp.]